jgi:hypothetical protein
MTNFMQVVAEKSNLKDGFNNPYNWASLMNINPLGFATGAIAFPTLANSNKNYPNGFRLGITIGQSVTPNDAFMISSFFLTLENIRYDIYTNTGTLLTIASDYVTDDNLNNHDIASFGSHTAHFNVAPTSGTYYIILRKGTYPTPTTITDPIELSIKFYSNGTSFSFTPF